MAAVLVLWLVFAPGCHSASGDPRLVREKAGSWIATARLATAAWAEERVPTVYARQALEVAETGLAEERRRLEERSTGEPDLREDIEHLSRAVLWIGDVRGATDRDDRASSAEPLAGLAAEEIALEDLARR
jgi:hypothetical protein